MTERRRFSRIIYHAPAELTQAGRVVTVQIRDLSLHGLLLISAEDTDWIDATQNVAISFTLPDSDVCIEATAEVLENHISQLRLSIVNIDIDSIGHLKRLVELNVGNDDLLHREIEHLSDLGEEH